MISAPLSTRPLRALVAALLTALCLGSSVQAQANSEPQREQLLNGLKVLIWPRPGEQDVLIKLRIHSGAAFDLAGKSGGMALLGDILFPDPATREYFTEQMQGRLNVTTDYDSMTITMQGKAGEFDRMIEILRNAVISTQLTPEVVASVREGRIKIVKDTSISPVTVADRAIAARLFGEFPYGQPHAGTAESIGRVDRADLMLARDRFLNPNNATLAIAGGVQPSRVMRTLRQLLGIWRKSERIIPATFRQPLPPDARTLVINVPSDESVEIRLATRGLARSDRNAPVATVLAGVARQRWEKQMPELARGPLFVRHEARLLPGMFVMGATVKTAQASKALAAARAVLKSLVTVPVSAAELEQAKSEALVVANKALASSDGVADAWLDLDTYKLTTIADQMTDLENVNAGDLQRTAKLLFDSSQIASVAIGNSEQIKVALEPHTQVELLGIVKPEGKTIDPAPAPKPPISSRPD